MEEYKELFIDLETTASPSNPKASILELNAILRVDGAIRETLDLKMKPKADTVYRFKPLKDKADLYEQSPLPSNEQGFFIFKKFLEKHVDKYD